MPPKNAKGKGPVSSLPQFAATTLAQPPTAMPLAPYKTTSKNYSAFLRSSKAKSYIGLSYNPLEQIFNADLFLWDSEQKICVPSALPPVNIVDAVGRVVPIGETTIRWMASNNRAFAIIGTANHGVVAIGSLTVPYLDANEPLEARPLQEFVSDMAGEHHRDSLEFPSNYNFTAGAVGEEHAIILGVDPSTGATSVFGIGWSGCGAVGPLGGMFGGGGRGAAKAHLQSKRTPLQKIESLSGEGITDIWSSRHVTVASGRRGALVLGKISEAFIAADPFLAVPVSSGEVNSVGITSNEGLWMLTNDGKVFTVSNHGEVKDATADIIPEELRAGGSSPSAPLVLKDLSCAASHCVARDANSGTLYGWGSNSFKQLGAGWDLVVEKATALKFPVKTVSVEVAVQAPVPAEEGGSSADVEGAGTNAETAGEGEEKTAAPKSEVIVTEVDGKNVSGVECIGFRTVLLLPGPHRVVLLGE